jgi:hypothetical protein
MDNEVSEYEDEWVIGKSWIDKFTTDFVDLDNLVDGVSLHNAKKAPMVGDVTLGTSVRQIPKSSIQQLPTFKTAVNGTENSEKAIISNYIVRGIIFNDDTFGKGMLSTLQITAESALTHGFQAVIVQLKSINDDFGSTMEMIHYNDLVVEPGIFGFNKSGYFQVRTRVVNSKIKKILAAAKKNKNTTWNVKALQQLLDNGPNSRSNYSAFASKPRANSAMDDNRNTFDIITRYEVAPFGEIVTYGPGVIDPLRTIQSKSKFGYPRVSALVIDPAQLTPFGVSRARLASPTANYANIYLQSTAKMLLLNADPPVFQRGQFISPIRLKRGALWQSLDPTAEVTLQELSNTTLEQFTNVLNFVDNQIYSVMGVTAGTTTPTTGTYQNKAAIQADQSVKDLSTSQVTHIAENFLRQYALTALDLYVSEQVGITELIVDDEAKDSLNELARGKFKPTVDPATQMPSEFVPPVGDDNIVIVDWDKFYNGTTTPDPVDPTQTKTVDEIKQWTVSINLSLAKDDMETKKRADAQDMLTVLSQTSNPNDPTDQSRKQSLENKMIESTFPEISEDFSAPQPVQTPLQQPPATGVPTPGGP